MMTFKVTPWEVSGAVDYQQLVREFGTTLLSPTLLRRMKKHTGEIHHFLRRKLFFSHRDLPWLLQQYEQGKRFYLYTGRGPSGQTHVGHMIPWMFTKWLQDMFAVPLWFQLTDDEKFLFRKDLSLDEVKAYSYDNALDVVALGFRQGRTRIFSNLDYISTLYPEALKVAKQLTYSTVRSVFGFSPQTNVGQIFFTSMQSVPAFLPSVLADQNIPCLIPHAIDQDPHFRITRDILPKLGYYKPASIHCKFLPPLGGMQGKMSSSDPRSTVYTTDSMGEIEQKILRYAFSGGRKSVREHRKRGGNPDIDVSYQWLLHFEEDDKKMKNIYHDYKSGALLTGELKYVLIKKLQRFLKHHQLRRNRAKQKLSKFIITT